MFLSNPRFVLAILAVSSFGNFPSVSAERKTDYFMYGGYMSTTDVEAIAARDEIQKDFEELGLADDSFCNNLVNAEEFFDGTLDDQQDPSTFLKDIPTYTGTQSQIFKIFSEFYGIDSITDNYARKWAKAALSGGEFFLNNFGDWGTMNDSCYGQLKAAFRGTAYLSGLLEVNQYMEQASELIRNDNCVLQFQDCEDAVNAWNKAAAFFVGSLEGAKGVFVTTYDSGKKPYGKMLYALGDKRCRNFMKCGVNADSGARNLPSKTNIVSIALFQKGAGFVFAGDVDSLQKTIQEINAQILITFIQGSLRYGWKFGLGNTMRSKKADVLAEAATYAACAAPQLWKINKKAGKFVSRQYKIGPEGPASKSEFDFKAVRNAFECNYKELGISCDEVGALWDDNQYPLSRQCTDEKNKCKKRNKWSIPSRKECRRFTKKEKKQ